MPVPRDSRLGPVCSVRACPLSFSSGRGSSGPPGIAITSGSTCTPISGQAGPRRRLRKLRRRDRHRPVGTRRPADPGGAESGEHHPSRSAGRPHPGDCHSHEPTRARIPLIDVGTIDLIRRRHIEVRGGIERFAATGVWGTRSPAAVRCSPDSTSAASMCLQQECCAKSPGRRRRSRATSCASAARDDDRRSIGQGRVTTLPAGLGPACRELRSA